MKLDLHHKLFIAFVAWCAIGVCFSDYPMMAFHGLLPYRGEGILTLFVVTALAFSYWKAFDRINYLAVFCFIACVGIMITYFVMVPWEQASWTGNSVYKARFDLMFVPDVALASFACLSGALLLGINPWLAVAAFPVILISQNRTAMYSLLIVSIGYFILKSKKKVCLVSFMLSGIALILMIAPLLPGKLVKLPSTQQIGHGARSQWLLQGADLAASLPLTGFGLDTLSQYLDAPTGEENEGLKKFICDKTHNIGMDLILQTGWIGFTLILLSFGWAVAICVNHPNNHNITCLLACCAWIVFGMANPHGLLTNSIALTSLFGIRKME